MDADESRAGQERQAVKPPSQSFSLVQMLTILVVGLVAGAASTWMLTLGSLDRATPWVDIFIGWVLPSLGFAGVMLVLLVPLTWWGIKHLLGRALGTLEQIFEEVAAAAENVTEGNSSAAKSHAKQAVREVLAWYAPIASRRWVVQTSLALLVGFGGLIGTAMLFRQTVLLGKQNEKLGEQTDLLRRQNDLLGSQNAKLDEQTDLFEDQNAKLDLQTVTAEAQRRAALVTELSAILQAISLINEETTGTTPSQRITEQVPRGLKARIVALSRAATPYRIIEVPDDPTDGGVIPKPHLADRPRSPERGQLLTGLVLSGVDISSLEGVSFASADAREAILPNAKLAKTNLSRAYLSRTYLIDANLYATNLEGADLRGAHLVNANLFTAHLRSAKMSGAYLINANLSRADLEDVNVRGSYLSGANLKGVNLRGTDLSEARLAGYRSPVDDPSPVDVPPADLSDTHLFHTDLTGAYVGLFRGPDKLPEGFPIGCDLTPAISSV
jgi:uncharacterized protein YjbI with pentapeptide repeats